MSHTHVRLLDKTHALLRKTATKEKRTLTAVLEIAIEEYARKSTDLRKSKETAPV